MGVKLKPGNIRVVTLKINTQNTVLNETNYIL